MRSSAPSPSSSGSVSMSRGSGARLSIRRKCMNRVPSAPLGQRSSNLPIHSSERDVTFLCVAGFHTNTRSPQLVSGSASRLNSPQASRTCWPSLEGTCWWRPARVIAAAPAAVTCRPRCRDARARRRDAAAPPQRHAPRGGGPVPRRPSATAVRVAASSPRRRGAGRATPPGWRGACARGG